MSDIKEITLHRFLYPTAVEAGKDAPPPNPNVSRGLAFNCSVNAEKNLATQEKVWL